MRETPKCTRWKSRTSITASAWTSVAAACGATESRKETKSLAVFTIVGVISRIYTPRF